MAVFLYLLVYVFAGNYVVGVLGSVLTQSKSIPVIGQPLVLTYTNQQTTNITDRVTVMLGASSIQGVCLSYITNNGRCGSGKGNYVSRQSGNVITLEIPSFNATQHAGVWSVTEGSNLRSNYLTFTPPFARLVLNLTGPDHAVINQSYTFLCSGTPAAEMVYNVLFYKMTSSSDVHMVCKVTHNCEEQLAASGYSCGCAGSSGNSKLYNLTINNVNLSHETDWKCQHAIDDVSNIIRLTVYSPVRSVTIKVSGTMSSSVDVIEGTPIVFTCLIHGAKPAPSVSQITWYREATSGNNQILPGSPGIPITSDRMTSLDFTYNASREHNNQNVFCTAINTLMVDQDDSDVTSSSTIHLMIRYPPPSPPEIKGYQTGTPLYESDTLTIFCEVKGGNPLVSSVSLRCYGGHQSTSSRVEGDTVIADLSFQISRNLNSKTCQCSASHQTNRYNDIDQETVTVYYPPSVPSLQAGAGGFPWLEGQQNNYLNCSVSERGNPPCTYVWFRDDVINSSQTSNTWTFSRLSYTDNRRRFYCQAENNYTLHKHDTQSSNILTLNVYYKPRVTLNHESSIQVKESQLLLLTCSSESRPGNATLDWFWGSQLMSSDRVLQIPRFTKDHQGVYTCRATVDSPLFGLLQGFANTTVRVMERFPDSCYCTGSSETSLTLQWIYPNTSSDAYSFTILQNVGDDNEWTDISSSKPRRDDDVFSLNVAQLQHTSRYYFKISIYGGGDHSGYCLTSCKTDAPPSITSRGLTGGAGIAVGAVVGIVVTSLVFVIVIIMWRRGFLFKFSKSDTKQDETNTYQDISLDDRTDTKVDTEVSQCQPANTYESLENREATPYCQLQLYENIKH